MAGTLERELKVEVDSAFHVPDLSSSVGVSVVSLPEVSLEATYYDTPSYDLARWGATLRHRVSSAGSQTWTLKLPAVETPGASASPDSLDRDEIDFEGAADKVPPDASAPLRTYVRDAALVPVAVLETRRRRNLLMSATETLAEMDDDSVDYRVADGRTGSFRELEIELSASGPVGILRRIRDVLTKAGVAEADPQPKLFRALGGAPPPAFPSGAEDWGPAPSAAELVSGVVARAAGALLRDDPRVRLGDGPQALARWRAVLDRLTAQLEDLQHLLDPAWYGPTRAGLQTLARHVELVTDVDTVLGRLTAGASRLLPEDQSPAAELVELVASQRKSQHEPLGDHLDSSGYLELVDRLVGAAQEPPLRRGRSRPAAAVVERALLRRLEHLERGVADAAAHGFHPSLRDRTERAGTDLDTLARAARDALCTAELAAELEGRRARKLLGALAQMDDWLAELGAATDCQQWLRDAGPELPGRLALAAGQLLAGETERANRARRHWGRAWKAVRDRARKWPTTA